MDNKNNARLGKGLSSIFGQDVSKVLDDIQNGDMEVERQEQSKIPVDEIRPNPYQPRQVFNDEALKELSSSIKQHGVFTPILVKKSIQGYDLIAGERRLRASKLAGLKDIPAIIVDFDDQEMMEIALLENIQREDLNVIEEAPVPVAANENNGISIEVALFCGEGSSLSSAVGRDISVATVLS